MHKITVMWGNRKKARFRYMWGTVSDWQKYHNIASFRNDSWLRFDFVLFFLSIFQSSFQLRRVLVIHSFRRFFWMILSPKSVVPGLELFLLDRSGCYLARTLQRCVSKLQRAGYLTRPGIPCILNTTYLACTVDVAVIASYIVNQEPLIETQSDFGQWWNTVSTSYILSLRRNV